MTNVTIVGNLVDAPELRFTSGGQAVASFTIAENKRVKDGDEWKDGAPTFWRCNIWREAAEDAAESLVKGLRVIAFGEVAQRSFETCEGEKRMVTEVTVSELGPSLRYATAKVLKSGGSKPKPPADDPWGAAPAAGEWGNPDDSTPPF